jgi:hypothetical protein
VKRLALSFFLILAGAVAAVGQTTQVTGTVKDVNAISYSGARMAAQLVFSGTPVSNPTVTISVLAQCKANGFASAPCQVPFNPNQGPFFLDTSGNIPGGGITLQDNALVTPAGAQWRFTVNSSGNPPPIGTGPQTCSAQLTITGASQSISASFASCPALSNLAGGSKFDTNGTYVSLNCGSASNCFTVSDNTIVDTDATWANAGTQVTTGGSDPSFTTADVGKIEFGTNNCFDGTAVPCHYVLPQGTITGIVSAHVVNVSAASSAASTGGTSNNFLYGTDDGAQLVAAFTSMFANRALGIGANLYLPCGNMMTSVSPFITSPQNGPIGIGVVGCGGGGTVIVPLPLMNCTGGAGKGCLIQDGVYIENLGQWGPGSKYKDITFFGGGTDVKDAAATVTAGTSGVYASFFTELDNVWVNGWLWSSATFNNPGIYLNGITAVNSGSYAGGNPCAAAQSLAGTTAVFMGGTYGACNGSSIDVRSGGTGNISTHGVYVNQTRSGAGCGVNVNNGAVYDDFGSQISSAICVPTGGLASLHGSLLNQFGGGISVISVSGGTLSLFGVQTIATGPPVTESAGVIIDGCGNNFPNVASSTWAANGFIGTCSTNQNATNTLVASRNTSLGSTTLLPANRWAVPNLTLQLYSYDSAAGAGCTGNSTAVYTFSYTDPTGTVQTSTATQTITGNGGATGGDALKTTLPIALQVNTAVTYTITFTPNGTCAPAPSFAGQVKII